jgi:hypothetical protein
MIAAFFVIFLEEDSVSNLMMVPHRGHRWALV